MKSSAAEMSMTPIALLCFALALREEAWSAARFAAVIIGVVGLSILFLPDTISSSDNAPSWLPILGAAAVTWAAISSALGSTLARPLMSAQSSAYIAAWTNLIGGLILILGSLIFEEGAAASLTEFWEWQAFAAWAYLVVFGSLIRIYTEEEAKLYSVRGAYGAGTFNGVNVPAFRDTKDIKPASRTETFVALKLLVDTWRWAGVPF
jgi:drug/metabolite transporter (DMT)-like permease